MRSPKHGLVRFRVKVIKKYNVPADVIKPQFRSKPKPSISRLYIGRKVSEKEAKNYLIDYFRKKNMWENIVRIQLQK